MNGLFARDCDRERAVALRRLLIRIENGAGEDRDLGADILNAIDAPPLMGDPTACIDCALHLARELKQEPYSEVLPAAVKVLRDRVRAGGWKPPGEISQSDVARTVTAIAVRVHIAKLEGAPA